MDVEYKLTIPGKPIGKGRPKFSTAGNYVRTYTPQQTVEYENLVRLAWMESGFEKLSGNVGVFISAYFPIPASISKKKREKMEGAFYDKKPDVDNICKIILDALNGIAYDDDKQVVKVAITKLYSAEPRAVVYIAGEGEFDEAEG